MSCQSFYSSNREENGIKTRLEFIRFHPKFFLCTWNVMGYQISMCSERYHGFICLYLTSSTTFLFLECHLFQLNLCSFLYCCLFLSVFLSCRFFDSTTVDNLCQPVLSNGPPFCEIARRSYGDLMMILGVTFIPHFDFSPHMAAICQRVRLRLNILKSLAGTSWGKQKKTLLGTFKAFNKSLITYAAPVWF